MKILGRLCYNVSSVERLNAAPGGYVVVNPQSAYVESYNGESIYGCDKFLVVVYAGNFRYHIYHSTDNYLSIEEAQKFIKDLAKKECVDLDEYDMRFTSIIQYSSLEVTNEWNEFDEEVIPLKVSIVSDES